MRRVSRFAVIVCWLFMGAAFQVGAAAPVGPSLVLGDQRLDGNKVIVESVVALEPGWVAIHAEAEVPGNPGTMVGGAPVQQGENNYLFVPVDVSRLTSVMYAVLHVDKGQRGEFEFPGPDEPAKLNGKPVIGTFHLLNQQSRPSAEQPSLSVRDQVLHDGEVVVGRVVAAQAGFVDIHAEAEQPGNPGPVIGYSPIAAGETTYVRVALPAGKTTPVMYAVLHIDEGEHGKFEFPGPDAPVKLDGRSVTAPFHLLPSGSQAVAADMSMSMGNALATATGPSPASSMNRASAATATATPTSTASPANTLAPSATPTLTLAPTATPTSAPTATSTPAPTATPTLAATATQASTATPAAQGVVNGQSRSATPNPELLPHTGGQVGPAAAAVATIAILLLIAGVALRRGHLRRE